MRASASSVDLGLQTVQTPASAPASGRLVANRLLLGTMRPITGRRRPRAEPGDAAS